MPRCPRDKTILLPLGNSYVCPRCDYKEFKRSKKWVPELHWKIAFPRDYAWGTFTATNASITNSVVSIDTGETTATVVSPQFTNLSRSTNQYRDFTKIRLGDITATLNDGKIYFYASNDGGTTWTLIKDNGHTWDLNYGNEKAGNGRSQTKYNDLRIKVELKRQSAGDTSPTISSLEAKYNHIPDDSRSTI